MATVTYEKNDENGDIIFTDGDPIQLTDNDAVAQMVLTRLRLFKGEWWENLKDGTPMFNDEVVGGAGGVNGVAAKAALIRARIAGTPYVTGLLNENFSYDSVSRKMNYSCTVITQFGSVTVTVSGSTAEIGA